LINAVRDNPYTGHLALVAGHADRIGGMEKFCRFLVETAAAAGWRVTVALSGEDVYDGLRIAYPDRINVDRVEWIDRTCAGDREYRWSRIRDRRRWFRRARLDVAVVVQSSNTPFRCAIVGAKLAGVPVISTHRTMAFPVEDVPSRRHCLGLLPGIGLHGRQVIAKTWLTALLANRIVYNSETVRQEYEALYRYPRKRGVVIRNAAEAGNAPTRVLADKPPVAQVTIGFIGRIGGDKRLDVLLRAVAMMEYRSKVRVVVYGEGAERPALEVLAAALGIADRVEWRGIAPNLESAYAEMDIVVLCSPRESSSNMVLEAMTAGKAVVVVQTGGMTELVGDGRCGICVPALNVSVLAIALDWLTTDDEFRCRLGQRARRKAIRHHKPVDIGWAWMSLLSEVAGRQVLATTETAVIADMHERTPVFR
jgi:glycosyltransferase involved in cell wall biosynthesis